MAADLAAADQHRRELIANVSHELRTPITALQAVLENIVDGVAEPDPTTLRTALAQTERLGRLVTELLDLSRLDAGAPPLRIALFEVRPFIDEVMAEARVMAAGGGARVRFGSTVEPLGAVAIGDRDRLKQVLLNLVDNAARHSPAGGMVALTARRSGASSCSTSATTGRASRPTSERRSSNASPVASGRPAAARASAWPSPAGSSASTAAPSQSSTCPSTGPARVALSGSPCRSGRPTPTTPS